MARPSLDSFAGSKPSLDSFVTTASPSVAAPEPSLASKTWSAIGSVAKSPLNPVSYAPAIGLGASAIASAPSDIADAFKAGVGQVKRGVEGLKTPGTARDKLDAILNVGSGAVSAVSAPLAPAFKPAGTQIEDLSNRASNNKTFQKFAMSLPEMQWNRLAQEAGNIGNIAGALSAAPTITSAIKSTPVKLSSIADSLTKTSEAQIEQSVLTKFEKGVKPLINAKMTPAKLENYRGDVINAVKTIKANKQNLSFNDVSGETITGQTPKSLQELADAIEQTKKATFEQYNAAAQQAGKSGLEIDLNPIASELDSVINNKSLALTNPKAVKYAIETQQRYIAAGKLDAVSAQDVIQNYNKSLEAFYRNPTYDTASQAAIDAMLANKVRTALDDGITGLTGEQYGVLKKQYGSLKSIEKDVIKASLRDARKNVKGLIDFTDILNGGQVVHGLLALNPATMASGIAGKAIAEFYKYLNNPNRAIQSMFEAADNLPQ